MEIKYPIAIIVTLILLGLAFALGRRKKGGVKDARRVANASLVKSTKAYKKMERKYRARVGIALGLMASGAVLLAVASARLVTVKEIEDKTYNRDIMLCMDVSVSMNDLNYEIVEAYKNIVNGMSGERFGISVFNESSYLLTPLTDDYEYVDEVLNEMSEAYRLVLSMGDNGGGKYHRSDMSDEYWDALVYLWAGTQVGDGGSSRTGEGTASCIYDFPDLDTERSRIIILSSDNDVYGSEMVDVVEAAKIAKKKNIKLYAIAPDVTSSQDLATLEQATGITDGKTYILNGNETAEAVISEIETTEKTLLEGTKKTAETDHPVVFYVCAFWMLTAAIIMWGVLR